MYKDVDSTVLSCLFVIISMCVVGSFFLYMFGIGPFLIIIGLMLNLLMVLYHDEIISFLCEKECNVLVSFYNLLMVIFSIVLFYYLFKIL